MRLPRRSCSHRRPGRPDRGGRARGAAGARPRLNRLLIPAGWALAACVLLGVGLLLGGRSTDGARETLYASATVERAELRGGQDGEHQIRVTASLDGFVTVIALRPGGRRQLVSPGAGGADVAAGPTPGEPVLLPTDAARALVVVTETPAGEPVRRVFGRGKVYAPDQAAELRADLERLLQEKGYRRAVVSLVNVPQQP